MSHLKELFSRQKIRDPNDELVILEDIVSLVLRDVAVGVRSLFAQLTG